MGKAEQRTRKRAVDHGQATEDGGWKRTGSTSNGSAVPRSQPRAPSSILSPEPRASTWLSCPGEAGGAFPVMCSLGHS